MFSDALDFVDLNITRAVQSSQQSAVRGYHRRVFANWADGSYLLWDAIDAPCESRNDSPQRACFISGAF
jgi:hypothetical protein